MEILVLEPEHMPPDVRNDLASLGQVVYGPLNGELLFRHLSSCEVLMVRLGNYIGADVLDLAPRLRFLVTATTGLDHIDLPAAAARGVRVVSLRDCAHLIRDVSATAEHTWGLLLALLRHTPAAVEHVRRGGWDRNQFWGSQLKGKRLGIVGFGRIGSMVAHYGSAFGMEVVAHDRVPAKITAPMQCASMEETFATSDVVSIHVTADSVNRQLIGRTQIGMMKVGGILINSARGMIVDSEALAEAIRAGRIGGVAVDVLEEEERGRTEGDPLLACARDGLNVLITPHIGGATREAIALAERAVVSVLAALVFRDPATTARESLECEW